MNKAELVQELATTTGATKSDTEMWLKAFTETVSRTLKTEEVRLVGFGTFKISERAARTGRNPQTGEAIKIKATRVPVFKAGKSLRDQVRT